jgi:hypothetical protein
MSYKVFFAYPSEPNQVGQAIEEAAKVIKNKQNITLETWKQIDIPGRFIIDGILEKINDSDYIAADITRLNFNVTYEIGYAIGRGKRVVLVLNSAFNPAVKEINELGIFDTIGYNRYQNSTELVALFERIEDINPLASKITKIDRSSPIYILNTLHQTDTSLRIISKIKKTKLHYRSFDPTEQIRLSVHEAFEGVSKSIAIVVNLLSQQSSDQKYNNLRGAFIAGLGAGLDKETLILQEGNEPVPIDYRDLVRIYKNSSDIDKYINELAPRVTEELQEFSGDLLLRPQRLLEKLDLGNPAAENEIRTLASYYVDTDEFQKVQAGSVRLAVGRKGSGKTALFFRLRDNVRRHKQNIVLDLRPEGHQLKRLKFLVLDQLQDAVKEHVATAFWEYLLLLEISHKILQSDYLYHQRNHNLSIPYKELSEAYSLDQCFDENDENIDFSERMLQLVENISRSFKRKYPDQNTQYLRTNEVTQLIYTHDIPKLRQKLINYLQHKEQVWILFDNIDKGWPTQGVTPTDITILRALLDASRKIEQYLSGKEIDAHTIVFLRNDVYEILVNESSDRGKESKVSLDWTDPDLLREFLRRRIVFNILSEDTNFDDSWNCICASHINGIRTSDYFIERSLMRPRNLLQIVNYAKSHAVNLRHDKIDANDILHATKVYSADILNEIGLEIRDVFPQAEDILYVFIDASPKLTLNEVGNYLHSGNISTEHEINRMIEILLWFSFLGVIRQSSQEEEEEVYIYNVFYDMKKLKSFAKGLKDTSIKVCIHPAFWPFLEING